MVSSIVRVKIFATQATKKQAKKIECILTENKPYALNRLNGY
jgi:hypothetical protein